MACRFQYNGRWTAGDEPAIRCHAGSGPGRITYHQNTSQTFGYTKTISWTNKDVIESFNCTVNGVDVPTEHSLDESSNVTSLWMKQQYYAVPCCGAHINIQWLPNASPSGPSATRGHTHLRRHGLRRVEYSTTDYILKYVRCGRKKVHIRYHLLISSCSGTVFHIWLALNFIHLVPWDVLT